jgi:hypothetical protein
MRASEPAQNAREQRLAEILLQPETDPALEIRAACGDDRFIVELD